MPKASALKVLVVDDQQSMRAIIKQILKQLGCNVVLEAKSGREALALLERNRFDLIISDWNMEDIDGLKLLKVLRKHPRTKTLPFIMATGQSDIDQIKTAIKEGVNNYIVKPFDTATVKRRIEAVLGELN